MREALDQWDFVLAAYALSLIGMAALVGWAWWDMRRAEARRDDVRRGGRTGK